MAQAGEQAAAQRLVHFHCVGRGAFHLHDVGARGVNANRAEHLIWIISGAFIGLGFIVPGLATSNFLMYFGLYDRMAAGIEKFDLTIVIPLFIGLVACVLLTAKLVNWLFNRHHEVMYHIIFGLVVGSSAAMFPSLVAPSFTAEALGVVGLEFWQLFLLAVAALVLGLFSILFSKLEERYPSDTTAVLVKDEDGVGK